MLFKRYKNLDNMKMASEEELASLDGMDARAAANVYEFLHGGEKDE